MPNKPKISVITCTYNAGNQIKSLLASILYQSEQSFEIIFCDGGSSDNTLQIIKSYMSTDSRIKLIHNEKKLPEGTGFGKSQAFSKSTGEIVLFIDQDNILQSPNIFKQAISIFKKNPSALGLLCGLRTDSKDSKVVRYVSLVGTDSFFAYRSIDFLRNLHNLPNPFQLSTNNMPLTGGNCFFYSSKTLKRIGGYSQDVLVIEKLIKQKINKLYIINNATKHYAESSIYALIKKKFFWASKFKDQNKEQFSYLPKTKVERKAFLKNLIFNLTIIPNLYYSLKIFKNKKDPVIFLFPIISFLNTKAYLLNFILSIATD